MSQPPPVPPVAPVSRKTSGLAIAALVCGVLSLLGGVVLIIPLLLAVILGHIAVVRCDRDPSLGGKGLGLAGLIMGYVSIVIGGLLASMAIPAFEKVREQAMQKTMANDARMIALAARQVMLTNGEKPVAFSIDLSTGAISGPLSEFVPRVTAGTTAIDGIVENSDDGFSLQNQKTYGGAVIRFDAEGHKIGNLARY